MRRPDQNRAERQLRRVIAGAVNDTLRAHPEYVTLAGNRWLAASLTKRAVGVILAYARRGSRAQPLAVDADAAGSRSGTSPAADRDGAVPAAPSDQGTDTDHDD